MSNLPTEQEAMRVLRQVPAAGRPRITTLWRAVPQAAPYFGVIVG